MTVDDLSERIVDALNAVHGVHTGFRAAHAKGSCCRGSFVAAAEASGLCVAPHLQGAEVPVTVRFSNGSGRPTRADGARDERGMAVKFHLPDGRTTDIVSLSLPVFFVRTPEDFLAFLDAQRPDPATGKPDLEKVQAFIEGEAAARRATDARIELRARLGRSERAQVVVLTGRGSIDPSHPVLTSGALVVTSEEGARRLAGRVPVASEVVVLGVQVVETQSVRRTWWVVGTKHERTLYAP